MLAGLVGAAYENSGVRIPFDVKRIQAKHSLKAEFQNDDSNYSMELRLGSNKQPVTVVIDTGSSDFWVVSAFGHCELSSKNEHTHSCFNRGVYNQFTSYSSRDLHEEFYSGYVDGSSTRGSFVTDDVTLNGKTIKDLQFGVSYRTTLSHGVLGLGFPSLESSSNKYNNFPSALKAQGLIDKNYYSLFMNGPEANSGTIIFGGVDVTKYYGELKTVPFLSGDRFSVNLLSISQDGHVIAVNTPVVLDSGSNMSLLPKKVVERIAKSMEGKFSKVINTYIVPCDVEGDFTYNFDNNASIRVSYASLIGQLKYTDGTAAKNQCYLKVYENNDSPCLLGENFLTQAYIVFDLEDRQASFAQVKYT